MSEPDWRVLADLLVRAVIATMEDPVASRVFDAAREAALRESLR